MGTFQKGGDAPLTGAAAIQRFYSDASWIEGVAEDQLKYVANMTGVEAVAAFPDLHPGKYGPVGTAILSDRIYPQFIGNDIGCGMSLFVLHLPRRKLRLDKAAGKLRVLEGAWDGDTSHRLEASDLPTELHASALGTIGGGNHFCELQTVGTVFDKAALTADLTSGTLLLFVHSGSRSLGMSVFSGVQHRFDGMDPGGAEGRTYLEAHDQAVRWASLNRQLIAERAAQALGSDLQLVVDVPHNLVEAFRGSVLHRKGAAKADVPLVPLASSRDALSYLLKPIGGKAEALETLAHGCGRKYDRRSMTGRVGATRSDRDGLCRTSFGGFVVCEDRQLLIEEAPAAYKDPAQVLTDLQAFALAEPVVSLKPLLTFKKAVNEDYDMARRDKRRRLSERRARR
ncbi:MAG: RNA ligase RtcB family protein [Roseibium sp.]|nr:RNA ligase RtcB family protein [Roseibium sp.]